MLAIVRNHGAVTLAQRAAPRRLRDDDVIVEVVRAGLCRTDLYVADGALCVREPLTLGHEFAGRVIEAAPDSAFRSGARVACLPLLPCRACEGCRQGERCASPRMLGLHTDGAFAQRVRVPAETLHPVPDALDFRRAAFAEPVAAALAVLDAELPARRRGLLLGEGRIAELTHRVLCAADIDCERATMPAPEAAGHFDFVIETRARGESLDPVLVLLRPGGTLVLKARPSAPVQVDLRRCVERGLRLQGVGWGSLERGLRWMASGRLPVDDLLGAEFELDAWPRLFDAGRRDEAHKLFLSVGEA